MLDECHRGAGYNQKRGVMFLNTDKMEPPPDLSSGDIEEHLLGVVLAHQFLLKKGLELFGEVTENAAEAEIQQYVDMNCYEPMDAKKLTKEGGKKALQALMLIEQKMSGKIKGQECAVGSKQRTYGGYDKKAGNSPTVSTDGLIITSAIDAHEERDVATVDVQGAFLWTLNDEKVLVLLKGK